MRVILALLVLVSFSLVEAQEISTANSGETCDSDRLRILGPNEGAIRYNAASSKFEVCGASDAWGDLGSYVGSVSGGPWTVSGTDVYRSSGNVGIGTTNPLSELHANGLIIADAGSGNGFGFERSLAAWPVLELGSVAADVLSLINPLNNDLALGTSDTERMRIDSSGKVGIGTTSPDAVLHAVGNILLGVDAAATRKGYTGVGNLQINSSLGNAGMLIDTPSTHAGYITFGDGAIAGRISYEHPSDHMAFYTSNAERMRIDSSGNVGIGTTNPSTKLHVLNSESTGTIADNAVAMVQSTNRQARLYLKSAANSASTLYLGDQTDDDSGYIQYNSANDFMVFATNASESMRIDVDGNVGIGTTSPSSTLHLIGPNGAITPIWIGDNTATQLVVHNNGAVGIGAGVQLIGGSLATSSIKFGDSDNGIQGGIHYSHDTESMWFQVGFDIPLYLVRSNTDAVGRVGIGTTSPGYTLQVSGTIGAVSYLNTSDERLKHKVEPLAYGLAKVRDLQPVSFEWREPQATPASGRQLGLIAQDVEQVIPEAVVTADDISGTKSIAYSELVPVLIKAVQELSAANDNQQQEIDELRATLERVRVRVGE